MEIGIAYNREANRHGVFYANGHVEIWEQEEALNVALSILHILSVIREEEVLRTTFDRVGVGKNQSEFLIEQWHKQRPETFLGEHNEQIRDNSDNNSSES